MYRFKLFFVAVVLPLMFLSACSGGDDDLTTGPAATPT